MVVYTFFSTLICIDSVYCRTNEDQYSFLFSLLFRFSSLFFLKVFFLTRQNRPIFVLTFIQSKSSSTHTTSSLSFHLCAVQREEAPNGGSALSTRPLCDDDDDDDERLFFRHLFVVVVVLFFVVVFRRIGGVLRKQRVVFEGIALITQRRERSNNT